MSNVQTPPQVTRTATIETLRRRAAFVPDTFDENRRTVQVVWTTGSRSLELDDLFGEPFFEELGLDPGEVRLGRLNDGAPLMDSHGEVTHRAGGSGLKDVIGVVESAQVDGARGIATVRFGVREDIAWIRDEVAAGTFQNLSMGYKVFAYAPAGEQDGIPVLRAVDWEPFELSLLPVGEDAGTTVRASTNTNLCTLLRERTRAMDPTQEPEETDVEPGTVDAGEGTETDTGAVDVTNTDAAELEEDVDAEDDGAEAEGTEGAEVPAGESTRGVRGGTRRAVDLVVDGVEYVRQRAPKTKAAQNAAAIRKGERYRAAQIRKVGQLLPAADRVQAVRSAIDGEWTLERFRAHVTDALAEADSKGTPMSGRTTVTHEEGDKRTAALANALAYRCGARELDTNGNWILTPLTDGGKEFVGLRLLDLGKEMLQTHGEKLRSLDPMKAATQIVRFRAGEHTRSDFPSLLEDAAGKTLRSAYEGAPRTFLSWTNRFLATDFKPVKRLQIGEGSQMKELPEGAKMEIGAVGEGKESYTLLDYARKFLLSRKAIINDDLDAFSRLPQRFGNKAAQLESDIVYNLLLANPTMGDGAALFSAGHGNTITTALGLAGLNDARVKMRNQTEIDGQRINVEGRIILVPSELELTAGQLVASIFPNAVGSANPLRASIDAIETEPRLSADDANDWYLAAQPSAIDTLEYAFLVGEEGPQIETMDDPDTLGIAIRVWEAFGAGVIDHRGLVKSTVT